MKPDLDICRKYSFVEGEGPSDAETMLVGQNPGREEERQKRPFVGVSGRYLDKVLAKYHLDRSRMYVTSIVKCRTPGNRPPTRKEINAFIPLLVEQIRRIRPRIIVLMGKIAWNTPRLDYSEYVATYHPAAAMRFPAIRKKFESDIMYLSKKLRGDKNIRR